MESNEVRAFTLTSVCASTVKIQVEHKLIISVEFVGGCKGSLTALGKAITGMTVTAAYLVLSDIPCRPSGSSCPAELAKILAQEYFDEK